MLFLIRIAIYLYRPHEVVNAFNSQPIYQKASIDLYLYRPHEVVNSLKSLNEYIKKETIVIYNYDHIFVRTL